MTAPQTYATHAHRPIAWVVAFTGAVLACGLLIWAAARETTLQSAALVVLGLVIVMTIGLVRTYALRLQDRIIRLEMQVRLARLGRESDFTRLSLRQLVALRFASDAELPALIDRALRENLTSTQIKQAVKDWQGDYLRT